MGPSRVPDAEQFDDFSAVNQQMLRPFSNFHQHYEPAVRNSVAGLPGHEEVEHAEHEKWWVEARICGDGSREAARNRKQGRQGQSRRRTQEQLQPLNH